MSEVETLRVHAYYVYGARVLDYTCIYVNMCIVDNHALLTSRLTDTAALHCGHTFLTGIVTANTEYVTRKRRLCLKNENKMTEPHGPISYVCAFSAE